MPPPVPAGEEEAAGNRARRERPPPGLARATRNAALTPVPNYRLLDWLCDPWRTSCVDVPCRTEFATSQPEGMSLAVRARREALSMARSIWKGSIRFGLVTIPVGLFNAEEVNELHFHLLDKRDMEPIHYQRVNASTGEEVPWDQTTRGYEYAKGKYLAVSDGDLKRASPEATQGIDILAFVELSSITPLFFER